MLNKNDYIKKFLDIVGSKKNYFPILIFISLLNSFVDIIGISLLVPFFSYLFLPEYNIPILSNFFGHYLKNELVLYLGLLIIISFFLKIFVATYLYYYVTKFSLNFQRELKIKILRKFQNLDFTDYTKSNSSNYFELITNLSPIFSNEVLMPVLKIISNLVLILALGILMFITNPKVFLILVLYFFSITIIYTFISKRNKIYGILASNASENFLNSVREIFNGFIEILIFKKKNFFLNRSIKFSKDNLDNSLKSLLIGFVPKYIIEFLLVLFFILYIFYVFFFDNQNINKALNLIIIYSAVSVRFIPCFNNIITSIASINFGLISIDRVHSNINIEDIDKKNNTYKREIELLKNENINFEKITFKDVSFQYERNLEVIKNLNLEIKKNHLVGVCGRSGSGKTTFLNLILGLLKPTTGEIFINEKIKLSKNLILWQEKLSYMPQDLFITKDSLRKNITFKEDFDEETDKKIFLALKEVELLDKVNNLEKGLDTEISEMGLSLSGGQRQRIVLARSIYHNKDILVLDEVTSALDSKTTDSIIKLLKNLKKNKTIIISTHNKNILNYCDKIIDLD